MRNSRSGPAACQTAASGQHWANLTMPQRLQLCQSSSVSATAPTDFPSGLSSDSLYESGSPTSAKVFLRLLRAT